MASALLVICLRFWGRHAELPLDSARHITNSTNSLIVSFTPPSNSMMTGGSRPLCGLHFFKNSAELGIYHLFQICRVTAVEVGIARIDCGDIVRSGSKRGGGHG